MFEAKVNAVYELIQQEKLDRIYCSITGMDYALLDESEIKAAVNIDVVMNPFASDESILDRWQLRHYAMCSAPSPVFRLFVKDHDGLKTIILNTEQGDRRLFGYLLGRFMHPESQYDRVEKVTYLRQVQSLLDQQLDWLTQTEGDGAEARACYESLALMDAIRSIKQWHSLSGWRSRFSDRLVQLLTVEGVTDYFKQLNDFITEVHEYALHWLKTSQSSPDRIAVGNRMMVGAAITILTRPIIEKPKNHIKTQLELDAITARARAPGEDAYRSEARHGFGVTLNLVRALEDKGLPISQQLMDEVNTIHQQRYNKPRYDDKGKRTAPKSKPRKTLDPDAVARRESIKAKLRLSMLKMNKQEG